MTSDILQHRGQVFEELFRRKLFDSFITRDGKKNHKQGEALTILVDGDTKEFGYGGAAGGAKSWTGCLWLAMSCKLYPSTKWFIGRVELKRLRETTLITFFKVCRKYSITGWKYNGQDHFIQFENGSRIDLLELEYKPSDPMFERFGSAEYTGGWIEEAGEVDFGAFDTLRSRVNRHMNDEYSLVPKLFITLNPKKNWVYEYFWKPYKEGKLPNGRVFVQSFAHDNPFNQEGYIQQLEGIKDPVRRARLLDGDFEYDDNPLVMMEYGKIIELYTNEFIQPTGTRYMTADIAYEGSDIFVIMIWDGLTVEKIIPRDKISEVMVPSWINENRVKYNVPLGNVIYDADGVKRYVKYSSTNGHLNGAREFHAQGKPNDAAYHNMKSECYYKLAEYVNGNKIFIKDEAHRKQVVEELEQIRKMEHADDGKLRIEKKDDLKKRLGRSPDFADALMMRMAFELKPPVRRFAGGSNWKP